jgi:DNA-binding NtrC family response regulator
VLLLPQKRSLRFFYHYFESFEFLNKVLKSIDIFHTIRHTVLNESFKMALILIIDDDSFMREMLVQMVTNQGHEVISAENGKAAEFFLKDTAIDLVITDIVMPEKEGLETIIQIHKLYPAKPIIAMSGGARIEPRAYLDLAKELGARYTFEKPFNRHELIEAINNCLNFKQTAM